MIRPAELEDIPACIDLLRELHEMHERPVAFDGSHCAGRLVVAICSLDWLALVVETEGVTGLLVASAGPTTICPAPVAVEHAWIVRAPGWGGKLRRAYEDWAMSMGCVAAHLSAAPGQDRTASIIARAGYRQAESSWVKVL